MQPENTTSSDQQAIQNENPSTFLTKLHTLLIQEKDIIMKKAISSRLLQLQNQIDNLLSEVSDNRVIDIEIHNLFTQNKQYLSHYSINQNNEIKQDSTTDNQDYILHLEQIIDNIQKQLNDLGIKTIKPSQNNLKELGISPSSKELLPNVNAIDTSYQETENKTKRERKTSLPGIFPEKISGSKDQVAGNFQRKRSNSFGDIRGQVRELSVFSGQSSSMERY